MGLRTALYLRVSTTNQDTERQEDQLRAVAAARGWKIVEVYADNGISGFEGSRQAAGVRPAAQGRRAQPVRHRHGLERRALSVWCGEQK
jgi:hypothetical protein